MNKAAVVLGLAAALMAAPGAAIARQGGHAVSGLVPVDGSGIRGVVTLAENGGGGTDISVVAVGLQPGGQYVSLYYDNGVCALEPYSEDDVIGGEYTADDSGLGRTSGEADDPLDEIHSVSVRRASDFQLLACAPVGTDEG